MHPQYGPAVFDYVINCWTYPYARFYDYKPDQDDEEEEKTPPKPLKEKAEIEI